MNRAVARSLVSRPYLGTTWSGLTSGVFCQRLLNFVLVGRPASPLARRVLSKPVAFIVVSPGGRRR